MYVCKCIYICISFIGKDTQKSDNIVCLQRRGLGWVAGKLYTYSLVLRVLKQMNVLSTHNI